MLTGGSERSGRCNVDWRNRADWRGECWLEEQSWRYGNRKEDTAVSSARKCFLPSKCLHCFINRMSCCTVLLEEQTGPQIGKKLLAFLERNVHYHIHNSLPFSLTVNHFSSKNLILFYHLHLILPSGHFPSAVDTKTLPKCSHPYVLYAPPTYLIFICSPY